MSVRLSVCLAGCLAGGWLAVCLSVGLYPFAMACAQRSLVERKGRCPHLQCLVLPVWGFTFHRHELSWALEISFMICNLGYRNKKAKQIWHPTPPAWILYIINQVCQSSCAPSQSSDVLWIVWTNWNGSVCHGSCRSCFWSVVSQATANANPRPCRRIPAVLLLQAPWPVHSWKWKRQDHWSLVKWRHESEANNRHSYGQSMSKPGIKIWMFEVTWPISVIGVIAE